MSETYYPIPPLTSANGTTLTLGKIVEALALVRSIGPVPFIRQSAFAPPGGIEIDGVLYVSPSVFRALKGKTDDQAG